MRPKFAAQQFIRTRRRSVPLRLLAKASHKYLKFWYNEDFYEFAYNGESFALDQFARWAGGDQITVWDVGAHRGEWSDAAIEALPDAEIHSFEIIPDIAAAIPPHPKRTVHTVGLSDHEGESEIYLVPDCDTLNTFKPYLDDSNFSSARKVRCRITTGDLLTARLGTPDLLKIDVEGHEVGVLRGCQAMFQGPNAPAMLQIEYGHTYLPYGSSLMEIFALLPGYAIGRLYPNHVEFKQYGYADDHHRMGNLIAVRDPRLKSMLES